MPDATSALRQAIDTVRAQIPKGELTVASVKRLLETAEAVCRTQEAAAAARPAPASPRPAASRQSSRRLEERRKWARIAKEAEREARAPALAAE